MSASAGDERLVVTLAMTDLAMVISSGDRIAQRGEGREEHSSLELLVSSLGGMLTADRGASVPASLPPSRMKAARSHVRRVIVDVRSDLSGGVP